MFLFRSLNNTHGLVWVRRAAAEIIVNFANMDGFHHIVASFASLQSLKQLADFRLIGKIYVPVHWDSLSICQKIGKGAVGEVYSARYEGNLVAVKVFNRNSISFSMEEFQMEVAMMSLMQHPRLVGALGLQ